MKKTIAHIYALGDQALTIEWDTTINEMANQQVLYAFHYLQSHPIEGITDLIPAYSSLTVVYHPPLIQKQAIGISAFEWLRKQLMDLLNAPTDDSPSTTPIVVPVCYDCSLAPDLAEAAAFAGMTIQELVAIHTNKSYKVYMLGFLPGFAYMASVDKAIQLPRKQNPRASVAPGSVGIAGPQTGIYPLDAPGGWQLIGRTPLKIFDLSLEQPCFFKPGDWVKFEAISLDIFHQMNLV